MPKPRGRRTREYIAYVGRPPWGTCERGVVLDRDELPAWISRHVYVSARNKREALRKSKLSCRKP